MEAILAAIESVSGVVGNVFTLITGNPLLTFFTGCGVLSAGIGMFGHLKHSVR